MSNKMTVSIDPHLRDELELMAAEDCTSMTSVINQLIRKESRERKRQRLIDQLATERLQAQAS